MKQRSRGADMTSNLNLKQSGVKIFNQTKRAPLVIFPLANRRWQMADGASRMQEN